jgi:hypothetical protein
MNDKELLELAAKSAEPEALRLAHLMEVTADMLEIPYKPNSRNTDRKAAAELRRLHTLNQELVEALSVCVYHGEGLSENHQSYLPPSVRYKAKSALTKARRTE